MTHPLSIEPADDWVCDLWWGEGEEEEDHTPDCPNCRDATDMAFNPESGKWECSYYKCK